MSPGAAEAAENQGWRLPVLLFVLLLAGHGWMVSRGWMQGNLPGQEFRQAQTALSTLFIQRAGDFSLAYPTPVLGAPWSVPMEFPLYQWTVAKLSDWTKLPLVQAGRAVSLGCFYLALAALYPLLGALGVAKPRRLVAMGFVLSCPIYIFYSRSFLIETMALMGSLWFLAAFGWMIRAPTPGRLVLVAVAGVVAGLVKVTTFMVFLLPAVLWTGWEMWRAWQADGPNAAARRGLWSMGAVLVPLVVTAWWIRFADEVKQRNSSAAFLESGGLLDFNFGTAENRFSEATLGAHWQNISQGVAGPWLLAAGVLLAATVGRRWWRQILLCLGCYLATLAVFPTLYAWHDYYGVANGVLLLMALGVAAAATLDLRSSWMPWVLLLVLHAGQGWNYRQTYSDMQRGPRLGGSEMTRALALMTNPDEAMIVIGHDWNSSLAFFSGRRALMIRNGMERDQAYLRRAFAAQDSAGMALLIVKNGGKQDPELLRLAGSFFGIDARPLFQWEDATIYGRTDLRDRMAHALHEAPWLMELRLDAGLAAAEAWPPVDREVLVGDMLDAERQRMFAGFSPQPWKFRFQFGGNRADETDRPGLVAHPATQLWFKVPAGRRMFRAECVVQASASEGPEEGRSDGVEFILEAEQPDGTRRRLASLLLEPGRQPADGGWHVLEWAGDVTEGTMLVLSTGPGRAGVLTRDWALLGPVKIQ